ncbi:MAG: hypothetical protein CMP20_01445 [Rickettsiales bacterium]|nr:hypothetical protein [Rickettsiales bacterium]
MARKSIRDQSAPKRSKGTEKSTKARTKKKSSKRQIDALRLEIADLDENEDQEEIEALQKQIKRLEKPRKSRTRKEHSPCIYERAFMQMICTPAGAVSNVPMVLITAMWMHFCNFLQTIGSPIKLDPETRLWLRTHKIFPGYNMLGYTLKKSMDKRKSEIERYVMGVFEGDVENMPGYTNTARVFLFNPSSWNKNKGAGVGFDIIEKMIIQGYRPQWENFVATCQTIYDDFKRYAPSRTAKLYGPNSERNILSQPRETVSPNETETEQDITNQWFDETA